MSDVKIVLGGDRGVGKTRLFRSLFNMPLSDISAYYPTFEPNINTITMNELNIEIWDLPGVLSHEANHRINIDFTNLGGAILLFDLSRIQTYESVSKWVERIWTESPGSPIIIVANKLDLAPTSKGSKKMIQFAQAFVNKINKETSFYSKFMEISATKEKNAFRVFNELLVAIQYMKGGKKDHPVLSELEQRIKPINDKGKENYQTPIFADEDKILFDLERLLASSKSKPKPATIQKITLFLKNSREIRKTFMHLKQFYVDELVSDAQTNNQWLIEENFYYLCMWKFFQQTLYQSIHPDELSNWCKQFCDMFIIDKESFDRLLDLSTKSLLNLLMKFKNSPEIIESGQFEMEIYVAYREEVYQS